MTGIQGPQRFRLCPSGHQTSQGLEYRFCFHPERTSDSPCPRNQQIAMHFSPRNTEHACQLIDAIMDSIQPTASEQ